MTSPHPLYRSLVRLYPRAFRREYGEDLVAHYADLVAERGVRAARTRTALDLAITIPRYHLEHAMTEQHRAAVPGIVVGLVAAAGVASVMTGVGPGVILLVVAVVLGVVQRSALARALRVPDSNRRRRRLRTGAILGVVFILSIVVYGLLIGDSWTARDTVLASIGTLAMLGAIGSLVAGLLTPHSPDQRLATHAR